MQEAMKKMRKKNNICLLQNHFGERVPGEYAGEDNEDDRSSRPEDKRVG